MQLLGFSLLSIGAVLSNAIPIDYVRDYNAYLMLGKNLYANGTYVDFKGELAWRPPGMALLYGIPLLVGIPEQLSVWTINSGILLIVFFCVKVFGQRNDCEALVIRDPGCSGDLPGNEPPLLLLPIAHLPSIATMLLLLVLVPTMARALAELLTVRLADRGRLDGNQCLVSCQSYPRVSHPLGGP